MRAQRPSRLGPGPKSSFTVLLGAALFSSVAFGGGCSLLYDLSTVQCARDADCRARGAAFTNTICEASLCVTPSPGSGGSGEGGGGGGEEPSGCKTNAECIDENFGSPFVCRSGECISLTQTPECPVVLGLGQDMKNLRSGDPIIIGAYSYVDPLSPRLSVPTLNYELAIDEFNEGTRGGLVGGTGGKLRPLVAVVCSGTNSPDLEASSEHLYGNLRVPAAISSLYTSDLLSTFLAQEATQGAFFMSPLEADSTLTSIEDQGLLWHTLASGPDLAVAFPPLLAQTEQFLTDVPSGELKVALVEARTPFLSDMANSVFGSLRWNGKSAVQNEKDGNFLRIQTDSSIEEGNPNTDEALLQLLKFAPDVIVAISSSEFVELMASYEVQRPGSARPPFYLFSPYLFGISAVSETVDAYGLSEHVLGVNFAAAEDSTLYDAYLSRLKRANSDVDFDLEGSENYYDATYFMLYAIAAASTAPLTGASIAQGMQRLIDGPVSYNVGPEDIGKLVAYLRKDPEAKVSLQGTMGPPDFDLETGARHGKPSVYCIRTSGFVQNAMTYDEETGLLKGSPPCIPGFAP